jgi:DNA-binding response OmpR family regulator
MSKCRLLVIEDEKDISDLVCHVATEADFDVRATCNVAEIASLYDEFVPHIVVLDIFMPDMDGMEVLGLLHKRNSSSRVIILSGQADYRPLASMLGEGLGLAVVASIAKPFRIAELRETLNRVRQLPAVTPAIMAPLQ